MLPRERVLTTLNHREPDRVPFNARLFPSLEESMQKEMSSGVDYRKYYNEDILFVGLPFEEYWNSTIDYLPLPVLEDMNRAGLEVRKLKKEGYFVCNSYLPGLFENIKAFLGDEEALVAMYESPESHMKKIEKVAEWLIKIYKMIASMNTDICWMGDDIGAQQSLIMSPELYRKFYRPFHLELVNSIKKENPNVKIAFHCCGHVTPLIPDLIDIGVDILECVQPEANNDLNYIKNEYGKDITFWGAIGTQSVFFDKSPKEVEAEVCKSLEIMCKGGGYIAAPCHTLTNEVTIDAVKAFYETMNKYGQYPNCGK